MARVRMRLQGRRRTLIEEKIKIDLFCFLFVFFSPQEMVKEDALLVVIYLRPEQ